VDRLSDDKWKPADAGGSREASAVDSSAVGLGETGDGTKSENSHLSADYDLGLGTQSTDTSGVSDVVELSWSSELDQSGLAAGTQPKDDIRKMTAQLKAQWWHNSPTPGDQTASKTATEISGKFDPRVSPNELYYDSRLEGKLENRSSENNVCGGGNVDDVEGQSDDIDETSGTPDAQRDMMDADPDDLVDKLDTDVERPDAREDDVIVSVPNVDTDTDQLDVRTDSGFARESARTDAEVDLDTESRREDDVNVDETQVDVSGDVSGKPEDMSSGDEKLGVDVHNADVDVTDTVAGTDASKVTEGGGKSEVLVPRSGSGKPLPKLDVHVGVDETLSTGPTSPGPPTRPKPVKSPPVRPPPFASPDEVRSETCPPVTRRKPPVDGKQSLSDSPAEPPVSPSSPDAPKTRTLDRVRPEKPPPPLPRTSRSRVSDAVSVESVAGVMDSSGDAVFSEDVAAHDEDTHL